MHDAGRDDGRDLRCVRPYRVFPVSVGPLTPPGARRGGMRSTSVSRLQSIIVVPPHTTAPGHQAALTPAPHAGKLRTDAMSALRDAVALAVMARIGAVAAAAAETAAACLRVR